MGIVAEPNEELKATIEWLREMVKRRDERITELEQQLAEAQPLIELGLATQQAQEQAQQD